MRWIALPALTGPGAWKCNVEHSLGGIDQTVFNAIIFQDLSFAFLTQIADSKFQNEKGMRYSTG